MKLISAPRLFRWLIPLCALLLAVSTAQAVPSVAREWNEQLLAAIRRNVPNPPAHARNLFHTAAAMYNAWAAYDAIAVGYVMNEKISPLPVDVELARREAISYAAYRILRSRFSTGAGAATSLASFDAKLIALGYSTTVGQSPVTMGTTPAELGKRLGEAILTWGINDGFSQVDFPQPYNTTVNPNMLTARAMTVMGNNGVFPSQENMQLGVGIPLISNTAQAYTADTDPNFWQPLGLSSSVTQNGIPTPGGIQSFIGVQSLATAPFSLTRTDGTKPWIDIGPPARLSTPGNPSTSDAQYKANALDVLKFSSILNSTSNINISPGAWGNNPLGLETGTGRAVNPVTGLPYAANVEKVGDFARVLAEFWADGPNSETPPGHWHVLANQVADNPLTVKKIGGVGPVVNDLEWDIKVYFSLAGAVHDAACAAWSLKRYYHGVRPITAIRYMGTKGQSSDPAQPSYHTQGLPLLTGVVEVITIPTVNSGRHSQIWDVYTQQYVQGATNLGKIVVFSWPGEHPSNAPAPSIATNQNTVRWMFAKDWLPFQRKTFNTPAFPGYVSGHSTFSRAAAEALTKITGSPYFPGGFANHTYAMNTMQIDRGPSAAVDLQWCSYYDAADQAGLSRRYGGIHPVEDDLPARVMASAVGISAYTLAEKYWSGTIENETISPTIVCLPNQDVVVSWAATRGMYHRVISSTDLINWQIQVTSPNAISYTTSGTWTDLNPAPLAKFYRVVRSDSPITAFP